MKHVNKEILLKLIITLSFFIFFATLLLTGKVKIYVHPRMIPLIVLSLILFIGIFYILIKKLFMQTKKIIKVRYYLIFIMVIVMVIFVQNNDNYTLAMDSYNKNAKVNTLEISKNDTDSIDTNKTESSSNSSNNNPDDTSAILADNININASNFVKTLNLFLKEPDKYDGKNITMDGFIYTDDKVKAPYFVLARYMMVCCAADMQITGLRCDSNNNQIFSNNTWVKVSGTLKKDSYDGEADLIIVINSIEKDSSPNTSYVYPF